MFRLWVRKLGYWIGCVLGAFLVIFMYLFAGKKRSKAWLDKQQARRNRDLAIAKAYLDFSNSLRMVLGENKVSSAIQTFSNIKPSARYLEDNQVYMEAIRIHKDPFLSALDVLMLKNDISGEKYLDLYDLMVRQDSTYKPVLKEYPYPEHMQCLNDVERLARTYYEKAIKK